MDVSLPPMGSPHWDVPRARTPLTTHRFFVKRVLVRPVSPLAVVHVGRVASDGNVIVSGARHISERYSNRARGNIGRQRVTRRWKRCSGEDEGKRAGTRPGAGSRRAERIRDEDPTEACRSKRGTDRSDTVRSRVRVPLVGGNPLSIKRKSRLSERKRGLGFGPGDDALGTSGVGGNASFRVFQLKNGERESVVENNE